MIQPPLRLLAEGDTVVERFQFVEVFFGVGSAGGNDFPPFPEIFGLR
jgi:hypothetical protein